MHLILNSALPAESPESIIEVERKTVVLESSQIYVHCYYRNGAGESGIRIWKTTYVVDRVSGARGSLIHVENITYAPDWTWLRPFSNHRFLLIFEGLPSDCERFDLVEDIGEPNGFYVGDIIRNSTDVYHVQI